MDTAGSSLIGVDGGTDEEKLRELLTFGCECTELDFKEVIDFDNKKEKLELVKDIVSMANHYPGGYLVIGACDDGTPSDRACENDWKKFDSAVLNDQLKSYIDVPIRLYSQHHDLGGHVFQVICVMSPKNGLPIPFSKPGRYDAGKGRQSTVFDKGVFLRRENAQNLPISYSQWGEILEVHDQAVRREERSSIDELIRRMTNALSEGGKLPVLTPGMPDDAICGALSECFERGATERIKRYIGQLKNLARNDASLIRELAIVACHAALYSDDEIFLSVAQAFYDLAQTAPLNSRNMLELQLELAVNAYIVGSAAVRSMRWETIAPLVNRPMNRDGYVYASWLRECQVNNSRARTIDSETSGSLISKALERMREGQALRPDVLGTWEGDDESPARELLLNSLCSFDYLYCVVVYTEGKGHGEAYPGCVLYKRQRIQQVIDALVSSDDSMRRRLLRDSDDEQLACGLRNLAELMRNEAMSHSLWLYDLDPTGSINSFIAQYGL